MVAVVMSEYYIGRFYACKTHHPPSILRFETISHLSYHSIQISKQDCDKQ